MGNGVSKDTSPDLSITTGNVTAMWSHTGVNLGSDHSILAPTILGEEYVTPLGRASLTDWPKFRERREQARRDSATTPSLTLEEWTTQIRKDMNCFTRKIRTTTKTPCVDPHLLHLWEARRGLIKRWKRQRLNCRLKRRIALLTEEAARYAAHLCKESWLSPCDSLRGQLSTSKILRLLRYLMDHSKSKTESNQTMQKMIHSHPGDSVALMKSLLDTYLPVHSKTPLHRTLDNQISNWMKTSTSMK
ncbi:hypothetical protein HPB48_010913 [Haemaphysalis longicornis]|uniref:Uncharacterized protein n=1 Tax=Haemaphysalis longicornis TaxID=44386 RepID=A0A9J6FW75_HAELO|nr:hypothetical protein HPB48_010913 [Haemaphysalis longicornis]